LADLLLVLALAVFAITIHVAWLSLTLKFAPLDPLSWAVALAMGALNWPAAKGLAWLTTLVKPQVLKQSAN
jgi:hypothetical protein